MGKLRLDKTEYQNHVLSHIAQIGYEKGCCEGIPVAYSTYTRYKRMHPEFAEKVEAAKKIFAGLPQNINAKIKLVQKLYDEAEHGAIAIVEDIDVDGNIIGKKIYRNPPRQWVCEKFFPKVDFLEKSIVLILGAEFKFLKVQDMPEEHRYIIMQFLQAFQQEGQVELTKRGINI